MPNTKSTMTFEESAMQSGVDLDKNKQNSQSDSKIRKIPRRLMNIPISYNKNERRNEAANEIEVMSNLLTEMQKEGNIRSEMMNSVFDKNFDGKIKSCINTRAEMERRAATFEAIIQSKTLIKKTLYGSSFEKEKKLTRQKDQEIKTENTSDDEINFSQTGSTSERMIKSPVEQEQLTLQQTPTTPQPIHKVAELTSPNKIDSEQIFNEHADKKMKGFGEAALTKVGHWSKNAFNFFRPKNSGKDATMLQKNLEITSHAASDYSRDRVEDEAIKKTLQESFKRKLRNQKQHKKKEHKAKGQGLKKTLQGSTKQKQLKKIKSVPKISAPKELASTSNALKKHAEKLTAAKRRLEERKAITFKKKNKLNLTTKETSPYEHAGTQTKQEVVTKQSKK